MTFDLDLWPTDLKINRDHLLTKDYLPTKFEASGAKRYWVISCTRLRATDIPTDRPTYRPTDIPTDRCKAICPPFSKGGINIRLAWPLTLNFDLLTWISIRVIYSSRTIYLPSLKVMGQSVLELSVAQGEVKWHDLWPWPLTYWPENQ